jgi:hypothetical protein
MDFCAVSWFSEAEMFSGQPLSLPFRGSAFAAVILSTAACASGLGSMEPSPKDQPARTNAAASTSIGTPAALRPVVLAVQSASQRSTFVRVTFSRPMLAGKDEEGEGNGVQWVHNYELDGAPMPSGTFVGCRTISCDQIQIDLPHTLAGGSRHELRISNVADRNALNLSPDPTTLNFVVEGP